MILLAGFGILGYILLRQTLPNAQIVLHTAAVHDSVFIYRDASGIPLILARSEHDAFFALGYLHAQDRIWQMDLFRRFGKGELAEILGAELLPVDYTMRLLQLRSLAEQMLQRLDTTARAALEAYTKGINTFLQTETLPIEFAILRYTPQPWSLLDCLILARLMGWELNVSYWTDLAFGAIAERIGVARAAQLFPPLPSRDSLPTVIASPLPINFTDSLLLSYIRFPLRNFWALLRYGQRSRFLIPSAGSNSWAVRGPDHLFLSSDPHLTYFLPPRWYAVQIAAPSLHVAGLTIPGLPFVIIGRNAAIAWGITNMMADDCDFFIERLDSTRKFYFVTDSTTAPLSFTDDTIAVRNADPIIFRIYRTRNGPIISPHHLATLLAMLGDTLAAVQQYLHRHVLALQWTGFFPTDEVSAFYKLQKATNWETFRRALRTYGTPALYFTYADTNGNIGIVPAGILPVRQGLTVLPRPGWNPAAQWHSYQTTAQLPAVLNPPKSFVFSANNPLAPQLNNGFLWEPISRAQRIVHWLEHLPNPQVEDMMLMQIDVKSPYARALIQSISTHIDTSDWNPSLRRWLYRLQQWDGTLLPGSSVAAFYTLLRLELTRLLLADELGETYDLYCFIASLPTRLLPTLLADSSYQWWVDDKTTPQKETVADILTRAFQQAQNRYRELATAHHTDTLQYGMIHQLELYHPLGIAQLLRPLVNLGPYPIGGDNTTINHQQWSYFAPFNVIIGPSMRFLTDLKQPKWWCILPGGQSGHPLHPHYNDQIQHWLFGQLLEIPFTTTPEHLSSVTQMAILPATP